MDRASYRYEPRPDRNAELREELVKLARQKPRYGYRRLHAVLERRGHAVNVKPATGSSLADTLARRFLQPAAKRAGIRKWIGFHTFRHTYSTLLKANGEDVKVVQELMRHANIATHNEHLHTSADTRLNSRLKVE